MRIGKYEIPSIPGLFAEDLPDDSTPDKKKKKAEGDRLVKIIEHNSENAEHQADFEVPIYNVWKQQEKSDSSSR